MASQAKCVGSARVPRPNSYTCCYSFLPTTLHAVASEGADALFPQRESDELAHDNRSGQEQGVTS
jgi:hypothetical protein